MSDAPAPAAPRPRWPGGPGGRGIDRQRTGRWIARLLFESALIIVSVLVALLANAWIERRAEAARIEEARRAFAEEVQHNRDLLAGADYAPYHRRMAAAFTALAGAEGAARDSASAVIDAEFSTGLHPTPLRDAVWRSLSAGSVFERMDYGEIVALADLYREQEALAASFDRLIGVFVEPRADADTPAFQRAFARSLALTLNDVTAAEGRLMEGYEEALAQLDVR